MQISTAARARLMFSLMLLEILYASAFLCYGSVIYSKVSFYNKKSQEFIFYKLLPYDIRVMMFIFLKANMMHVQLKGM